MNAQLTKRLVLNTKHEGFMTCEICGISITVHADHQQHPTEPLKIFCPCGSFFCVALDKRKYYRKRTQLPGVFFQDAQGQDLGKMIVENMSFGGLRFRTLEPHTLRLQECIHVKFCLDDTQRSIVSEPVRVRFVRDEVIGAMFLSTDSFNKALALYLMA